LKGRGLERGPLAPVQGKKVRITCTRGLATIGELPKNSRKALLGKTYQRPSLSLGALIKPVEGESKLKGALSISRQASSWGSGKGKGERKERTSYEGRKKMGD